MTRNIQFLHALMLVVLSIQMTACTKHAPVRLPTIKVNPNPTERYQITIQINEELASPERLAGKSTYAIDNPEQCLPLDYTRAIGGVRPELYRERAQVYEKVGTHIFQTYVYEDAFLNEDYYGMSACDWGVQGAIFDIMSGSSRYGAYVTRRNIIGEKALTVYCSDDGDPKLGCKSAERYEQLAPEVQQRLRKIEIHSKKLSP